VFRLRLLRILLPLLLVAVACVLYLSWEPRMAVHSISDGMESVSEPQASGVWFVEYDGERRVVAGDVAHLEQGDNGELRLEGIRDLEIHREDRGPLIINAARGNRQGDEGHRMWHFEERVVFRESDRGLNLVLPVLDIDEAAGEARSEGDIRLHAPKLDGHAEGLVYGLRGQPGKLVRPVLNQAEGGRVTSREATLWDGVRDVEMIGEVTVLQQGERLDAGRMRLWHGKDERLERVLFSERVWGSWPMGVGPPGYVRADDLDIQLDESGEARRVWLSGDALLRRSAQSLAGTTIEIEREGATPSRWRVTANGNVVVQALFGGVPGLLRTESLKATMDDALGLKSGEATGRVSFEGGETRAEADRAIFRGEGEVGQIELYADERSKARLSYETTRVAGARIFTDTQGHSLVAEERVEASLLPARSEDGGRGPAHLFAAAEAIHFVASRLESLEAGAVLHFTGSVRGWQGESNLAAEELFVDQRTNGMEADREVSTRFPRLEAGTALSENEYVQIRADHLSFDGEAGLAVYTGKVRVRLAEGWLEAQRVEVDLAEETREIRQVRAEGTVRLEFQRSATGELDAPVTGEADRAVYEPSSMTMFLYGDQAPASVESRGKGGGTTTGRMLAYRLDLGTLDVESGGQGPASIRTTGG